EGNPIDMVLGEMERSFGGVASGAMMSGKGKSFFLHDLLRKVIFAEAGWVSTDRRAVRRKALIRAAAFTSIAIVTFGMIGLWGLSFLQNRELVQAAQAAIADYELDAQDELRRTEIDTFDLTEILPYLRDLRQMPLGVGDQSGSRPLTERFGLSQRARLRSAAETTYRQALERMFRSRLIFRVEKELEGHVRNGAVLPVYETLKVYKLLGDVAPKSDDPFVIAWFRRDWQDTIYPGPQLADTRDQLELHLTSMLELGKGHDAALELNGALIDQAERTLARMNVGEQAYSLILATAEFTDIEEFSVINRAGRDAAEVFETIDGTALEDLRIPPLYTYRGFHEFFLPQLSEIADSLIEEQWVMGEYAAEAQIEDQIGRVGPPLLRRYSDDWIREWDKVLGNIKLRPMASDKPSYQTLAAASAARTSPMLLLTEQIVAETKLTSEFTEPRGGGADAAEIAEGVADQIGERALDQFVSRQTGLKRIGLDAILDNTGVGKNQSRAGGGGGGGPQRLPGAEIEAHFAEWDDLLRGDVGSRRIDLLLQTLNDMQRALILSVDFPSQGAVQMPPLLGALKQNASRLPDPMAYMIKEAIDDFEGERNDTDLERLREALNDKVTRVCEATVSNAFPFSSNSQRDVPMQEFSALFAPQGVIDRFFLEELSAHAITGGGQWTWDPDSKLAGRLSNSTLRQFQLAAEIRDAFFPGGGGVPSITLTIDKTD
ncbi:MAG: type VI secretion system membrane subunit TssM, partial [Pseudomonadota bacterium]